EELTDLTRLAHDDGPLDRIRTERVDPRTVEAAEARQPSGGTVSIPDNDRRFAQMPVRTSRDNRKLKHRASCRVRDHAVFGGALTHALQRQRRSAQPGGIG